MLDYFDSDYPHICTCPLLLLGVLACDVDKGNLLVGKLYRPCPKKFLELTIPEHSVLLFAISWRVTCRRVL